MKNIYSIEVILVDTNGDQNIFSLDADLMDDLLFELESCVLDSARNNHKESGKYAINMRFIRNGVAVKEIYDIYDLNLKRGIVLYSDKAIDKIVKH